MNRLMTLLSKVPSTSCVLLIAAVTPCDGPNYEESEERPELVTGGVEGPEVLIGGDSAYEYGVELSFEGEAVASRIRDGRVEGVGGVSFSGVQGDRLCTIGRLVMLDSRPSVVVDLPINETAYVAPQMPVEFVCTDGTCTARFRVWVGAVPYPCATNSVAFRPTLTGIVYGDLGNEAPVPPAPMTVVVDVEDGSDSWDCPRSDPECFSR